MALLPSQACKSCSANTPGLASFSVDVLSHPADESVYYSREMTALERTGRWGRRCILSAAKSHWFMGSVNVYLVQRELDVEVRDIT